MKVIKTLSLFVTLLVTIPLQSQGRNLIQTPTQQSTEEWSLDKCLKYAKENNYSMPIYLDSFFLKFNWEMPVSQKHFC